jgi:hypothetical protein
VAWASLQKQQFPGHSCPRISATIHNQFDEFWVANIGVKSARKIFLSYNVEAA